MKKSTLEKKFEAIWKRTYPDEPIDAEVCLIPGRKFRFDFVHKPSKTAIEINGGLFVQGRHNRGEQMKKEYLKFLLANLEGYLVIPIGTNQVTAEMLEMIHQVIVMRMRTNGH